MKKLLSFIFLSMPISMMAQSDSGLDLSIEGSHKFSKNFSASINVDVRTRDNFKAWDRWSAGVDMSYKFCDYLKMSAGYDIILDHNEEKINRDEDGSPSSWRPSYMGERHRFNVSLTGSVDLGRFNISLRERWQHTLRPEKVRSRYNFDAEDWEEKIINGKAKSVLRSRLQVEYNIRKCPVSPYANVEFFNAWSLAKTRFTVGGEWKINKKQSLGVFYRYQSVRNDDDDNEPNLHIVGASYNFKF